MPGGMMDGMGSMMAWMMGLGLLSWVLVIAALVAIVVLLLRLSRRADPRERSGSRAPGQAPD